jgi:hypothetical protein
VDVPCPTERRKCNPGAFRRSELVALNVADLEFCDGGLRVTIHKSKSHIAHNKPVPNVFIGQNVTWRWQSARLVFDDGKEGSEISTRAERVNVELGFSNLISLCSLV